VATTTLFVSLGCLIGAFVVHVEARRLAVETPVTATVAKVWSKRARGGPIYFAQLIFDRKQSDGEIIHCDVPDVRIGAQPKTVGARIKVAPRLTTCWEPDIICETLRRTQQSSCARLADSCGCLRSRLLPSGPDYIAREE
jgi:hypothetical protein